MAVGESEREPLSVAARDNDLRLPANDDPGIDKRLRNAIGIGQPVDLRGRDCWERGCAAARGNLGIDRRAACRG